MTASAIDEVFERRHSCRAFRAEPVPQHDIDRVLELAQRAPSWCNTQPWHTILLSGDEVARLADALTDAATSRRAARWDIEPPAEYLGDHLARRRDAGIRLYRAVGVARHDMDARRIQHLENFRFFGAPHVLIVTADDALGPYGLVDTGVFLGSLLALADGAGMAIVAQAAIAQYSDLLRARYDIPESRRVVCAVAFGYEDTGHPANAFRTTRATALEAVTRG